MSNELNHIHTYHKYVCTISYQSNTAKTCLDTILNIQPKDSSSGGGETRESIVSRQAGEMLDKLPNDYIPHEVSREKEVRLKGFY